MADFSTLKAAVKAKVAALTDHFSVDPVSVFDFEPDVGDISADPWATVIASGNENAYGSNAENKRSYGFIVRIFVKRGTSRTKQEAETLLQTIVDSLIDDFDQDYTMGGLALKSKAVPSRWGYVGEVDEYRMAEIQVTLETWFDITV